MNEILKFTDLHQKNLSLMSDGIRLWRDKGLYEKFDKTIPYSAVLDIYHQEATMFQVGFFSILTSVDGIGQPCNLSSVKETHVVCSDKNSFTYRKKHKETVEKIIETLKENKKNSCNIQYDPSVEYLGTQMKDTWGKQIVLQEEGLEIISKKKSSKVIAYENILDIYVRYSNSLLESTVLSIVENTGISALKKIEYLSSTAAVELMNDENTLQFHYLKNSEVEKLYLALKHLRHNSIASNDKASDVNLHNNTIDNISGHDFEFFCAEVLERNNFKEIQVTKGSGDQGVDILATKDGIKYAVQCKKYVTPLGNKPVQEVNAGKTFYNCHVGVVMTNSTFTPGAIALAQATGVLLWDGAVLEKMMNI